MRVIVTRPEREAQDWALALRQAGWPAETLSLIDIAPAPDLGAVRAAWSQLGADAGPQRWSALMFVSANAVEGFFAARPAGAPVLASTPTQAWATGPGTARALAVADWPATHIVAPPEDAPQFDSEALWGRVAQQVGPGSRVLIVRGADEADVAAARTEPLGVEGPVVSGRGSGGAGRDWFARQVRAAGGQVAFVASYQRCLPRWAPQAPQWRGARTAADGGAVWLFSSSEAVRNLRSLLPDQDWGAARALVTHERIAQVARAAGFVDIAVTRPALLDVQNALSVLAGREPR